MPFYSREAAKEKAREKEHEDRRDEWITCPECGSGDAVIVNWSYDAFAACPECGFHTEIYSE